MRSISISIMLIMRMVMDYLREKIIIIRIKSMSSISITIMLIMRMVMDLSSSA